MIEAGHCLAHILVNRNFWPGPADSLPPLFTWFHKNGGKDIVPTYKVWNCRKDFNNYDLTLLWTFYHLLHILQSCPPEDGTICIVTYQLVFKGGHLVRYPWSVLSDWAWYRNFQYRTERAESDIISDIGIKFYPICDIWHPILNR